MTLRRGLLPKAAPYDALIARIAAFTHERSTLVVEARMTARRLRALVDAAGGDLEHLHILDATGLSETMPADDEHETNVSGPHLLELIAVRAKRLAVHKAERRVVVVIDDVWAFARFNRTAALVETVHLARNLHDDSNVQEFIIHPDMPPELQDRLEGVLDVAVSIGADGRSA